MSSEWESTDSMKGATGKRGKELKTDHYQNEYLLQLSMSTLRTVNARIHNQQASHHFFLSASAVHQERSRRAGSCTTFGRRQLQFIRLGMRCSLWVVTPMSCSTLSVSSEWESQGELDSVEPGATGKKGKVVETDRHQKI